MDMTLQRMIRNDVQRSEHNFSDTHIQTIINATAALLESAGPDTRAAYAYRLECWKEVQSTRAMRRHW